MASKGLQSFTRSLSALRSLTASSNDPLTQCLTPRLSRSMATEASLPSDVLVGLDGMTLSSRPTAVAPVTDVLTTIYKFPTMEPLRFESYPSKHLHLPLRRDILHRAVVFEGDFTRQGTASTKTRHEIHGSHRKIRPQKGTGMARLGTRQSPMLKGGAKTFGPRPRDFATGLPKKMYDLAWRTALSYRYRKGELIICENGMEIDYPYKQRAKQIFNHNRWGREDGRTLLVTRHFKKNLFAAMESAGDLGRVQMLEDVDVKDLLELGRIVIEKGALDQLIREHSSDLTPKVKIVV